MTGHIDFDNLVFNLLLVLGASPPFALRARRRVRFGLVTAKGGGVEMPEMLGGLDVFMDSAQAEKNDGDDKCGSHPDPGNQPHPSIPYAWSSQARKMTGISQSKRESNENGIAKTTSTLLP